MKFLAALFSDVDLPRRFRGQIPPILTQFFVANACLLLGLAVRLLMNAIAPGAAPFALIFPMMMLATLFAGLLSGLMVAVPALLFAWYVMMPVQWSFQFADKSGPPALTVVTMAVALTLVVAQLFREAVRRARLERERQIADRDLFLREFDHRVKNNFAIVISLLDLQRRRADPATAAALSTALQRVEGIARAHGHLYRGDTHQPGTVDIATYLNELCTALGDALNMSAGISIECHSDVANVPRDRAVSIGLIVNELVTNAVKHAFVGRDGGMIRVDFRVVPDGWQVEVGDNGSGYDKQATAKDRRNGGLGTKLVDAFARQANGSVKVASDDAGTRVTVDIIA